MDSPVMPLQDTHRGRGPVALLMVFEIVLGGACKRSNDPRGGDAGASSAKDASVDSGSTAATTAATAATTARDAGGASRCAASKLQPGTCVPALGPIRRDFEEWFVGHGVPKDRAPSVSVEGCDEFPLGSPNEVVLACVVSEPVQVAGLDGPTQINESLRVFSVRDHNAVSLAAIPVGVSSSESDLLFRARYELSPATRSLDLTLDPDECKAANGRLASYWNAKTAEVRRTRTGDSQRELVRMIELERQKEGARIAAICAQGRHHTLPPPKAR